MPFSNDPVIRLLHCVFIVFKIPLFSMPSSHDPVIRMFHCLFIVLKVQNYKCSFSKMVYFFTGINIVDS
jgi:hypothetical protein